MVPGGYVESLETGDNRLADERLRAYYDEIRLITRSPRLLSAERLRAIALMNTGRFDHLVDETYYRFSGSIVPLHRVATVKTDGTPGNDPGNHRLMPPLAVTCDDRPGRRYLDVSLDSDDHYQLTFLKGNRVIARLDLGSIPEFRRRPGLVSHTAEIPPAAVEQGFDMIIVAGIGGNEQYAMGHLLIEGVAETDGELHRRRAAAGEFIAPR
jgi:arabinofuranosyltransferase